MDRSQFLVTSSNQYRTNIFSFCLHQLNLDFLTLVTGSLLTNISLESHCRSWFTSLSLISFIYKIEVLFSEDQRSQVSVSMLSIEFSSLPFCEREHS